MRLLSFYAGILQFAISVFQLGIIFNWLPDFFISAFISGVSFHVITSQVFHMFGIDKNGFKITGIRSSKSNAHFESVLNQTVDFKNGSIWPVSLLVSSLCQYQIIQFDFWYV